MPLMSHHICNTSTLLGRGVTPDEEEVAVDAIPLATKPLSIVDWKILKEGKISYYQIIRADGSSKRYSAFIQMLRRFDREDLETLWKLVKAKHGRYSVEEFTRKQSVGLEAILFLWSTFCEVSKSTCLYVGREEISSYNPLATKPPSIVDWKILKEGKISYYQIIRADGSSKRYSAFIQMLRRFDREYLETLGKLVKAKHEYRRPEEDYERVLWGDLKTMFEHHVEDTVWRNLQGNKVLVWKLFDSCGVYFVRFQSLHVFMLVEKRYPLTPAIITEMLNKKLRIVGIKRLLDDLRVTAAKLMLIVYKLLLLVFRVNAAGTKSIQVGSTDHERTESDRDENPNLSLSSTKFDEEEKESERVYTPTEFLPTHDEEKIDDKEKMDEEEDDEVTKELYKDVNVNLGNKDANMTNADQGGADQYNVSQESGFE
ncbi:hypothetical protein Tco_0377421 [Tanacetum coccineum]